MSVVALADGTKSSITIDVLRDVAAKNNITIPTAADEEAYLILLQSADATVTTVNQLPDYVDPRLHPVPVVGGERKYWKAEHNSLNGWSHRTSLVAEKPSSNTLQGRTIAIKDNMSVGGLPLTVGTFPQLTSPDGKYPISPIDATIVSRVLKAGATIVGTSTCENYSCTPLSYTSASGPVHNPWLFGRTVGGSSSGNAALLSLGLARKAGDVPGLDDSAGDSIELALGGDQGGSIRIPASFTGVYGLKPTMGLVPYTGIASLHPMIDHCGPMATNLMDIARLLRVIAGYDGLDPRMTPESPLREHVKDYAAELSAFTARKLPTGSKLGTGLRIGLLTESFTTVSDAVRTTIHAAATRHFAAAGATVHEISIPLHHHGPAIWTAATRSSTASYAVQGTPPPLLSHPLPHWQPRWPPDQEMYDLLTSANPAVINLLFWSSFSNTTTTTNNNNNNNNPAAAAATTAKAHRHVLELRAAYDKALNDQVDVLITPTTPTVASKHADVRPGGGGSSSSSVMDKMRLAVGVMSNTCPFNATGHPALSVPCGWGEADDNNDNNDGEGEACGKKKDKKVLPIGMQIIGKRWDEMGVLKAAAVFEEGGGGLGPWEDRQREREGERKRGKGERVER